jgi:hypothetical protein
MKISHGWCASFATILGMSDESKNKIKNKPSHVNFWRR